MNLASNSRRDDTWFDVPSPTGSTLIPDQTFATPHPSQTLTKGRTQSKVDTLLSTPWFGETASDAEEWRKVAAERRARASSVPTLIISGPTQTRPLQARPVVALSQRPALRPTRRVPLWVVAVVSSGLLLTSALLVGALIVLASLLILLIL
jgi:hypothetical protein